MRAHDGSLMSLHEPATVGYRVDRSLDRQVAAPIAPLPSAAGSFTMPHALHSGRVFAVA